MLPAPGHLFLCSCEASLTPDEAAIRAGLGEAAPAITRCTALCTREKGLLAGMTGPLTIACGQEEVSLRDALEDAGYEGEARFIDIRDRAGWSSEGESAGPKMAALLAMGQLPAPALPFTTLESEGVTLIYGQSDVALAIGQSLADVLDITVMLKAAEGVVPPRQRAFPIVSGVIRAAKGHLGAFELTIDGFALASPASRGALRFGARKNGATSRCDLVIDVSGGSPLFSASVLREGYLRADPNNPLAIETLIAKARELVGTFDKPTYITVSPELCAHSRSGITGCMRCLDVCPTGAISPAGNNVAIDAAICAGCGGCAALCPTGAAAYALPEADALMLRLRTALTTYHAAGGQEAVLLMHEAEAGEAMIDALARFGDGLPARVIPVSVHEITQIGLEQIAAAFAYGAAGMAFLLPEKPKHPLTALETTASFGKTLLGALGQPEEALALIATNDPDRLLDALRAMPGGGLESRASFNPRGSKRAVLRLALREWQARAPLKPESVALPQGAPFGKVEVKVEGCTLCLACVSACPTAALSANPERPELRFQEDLCVQCGLCAATCPEKVASLTPQLDFTRINAAPITLKEEEPYLCEECGTPFGTRSSILRIKEKLGGTHWMSSGANADRLKLIGCCDTCRIEAATLKGFDPYAGPERPRVKTSEDYFKQRQEDQE